MIKANPHAVIQIGETNYDSWIDKSLFKSLTVDLTTGEASEAVWTIFDPEYKFLDRYTTDDVVPELEAKVWMGLGKDLGEEVFYGLLTSVELEESGCTLRFYDFGYKMRQVQQTDYHKRLTDVEIIAKLAKQNGLEFEGPQPAIKLDKHKSRIQKGETDWQHAQDCAERAGLKLHVRGRQLYAKEAAKTTAPVATLKRGKDFRLLRGYSFRFRPPENQEGKPAEVEVRGRGIGGRRLSAKSQVNERGTKRLRIRSMSTPSKANAKRRAQAQKDLHREHAFSGSIRILPDYEGRRPDCRDTVRVLGIGEIFSGRYIIDRVQHSFAPGKLETSLEVYRDVETPR